MKNTIATLTFIFCFGIMCSQTIALPETIITLNAEYLSFEASKNRCDYVKKIEQALLSYKHDAISELYDRKDDIYMVTFELPEGKIIASFNNDGKIVKTFETYHNVRLPENILQSISKKYPKYAIVSDKYTVKYNMKSGHLKQVYRIIIENMNTVITLKTNNQGELI